ncbi:MAG: hypothetical protein HYZ29_11595 [Myxococcales bacterium]|nr:hypothetical protein [Myxococcales bacterium]
MSLKPVALSFLLLAACAHPTTAKGPGHSAAPGAARPNGTIAATAPTVATAESRSPRAHAVLTAGARAFVITGSATASAGPTHRELLPGGFAVEVGPKTDVAPRAFTLVGPDGTCTASARHQVRLGLDYGGYAGAPLPGPRHTALEIDGCHALIRAQSFLIALEGADKAASWVHPAHVDEARAPADRRLGENEVWLHRWAFPSADLEIVERSVLTFVTPSCSEERRDVLVVDELGHPVARHAGFSLRGGVQTATGPLLVLVGHDEPEALRVIDLGAADGSVALDTRVDLLPDVEKAEC